MNKSICGIDCEKCELSSGCGGCRETNGSPFGGGCVVAGCCLEKTGAACGESFALKARIIDEINALSIDGMEKVTDLYSLRGSFVNLEYALPGGQKIKFWDDDRVYLGNQLSKAGSDRCYGITANESYILVCEYGEGGKDAEIILYKKRSAE